MDRRYDILLAGIDTQDHNRSTDTEQLDREIITDLNLIDAEDCTDNVSHIESAEDSAVARAD